MAFRLPNLKESLLFAGEVAVCYATVHLFAENVVSPTLCIGSSMQPTIYPSGEMALVDIFSYKYGHKEYQRGDVVIAYTPDGKKVCKRIRALEGDVVTNRISPYKEEMVALQKGEVWLQGDNPSNSIDSRMYGPIPLSSIEGRVFWKVRIVSGPVPKDFEYLNDDDELNDTKVVPGDEQDGRNASEEFSEAHNTPNPQQASINSDTPSNNVRKSNTQSADCQGMVYEYHRQKALGPAVKHEKGAVSSTVVEYGSTAPSLSSQKSRKDLEELLASAVSKHEHQSSSLISSWLNNNLFKKAT